MARHRLLQDPGRRQEGVAGRDQEGLPQARAQVPPGHQQGGRGGGALQGDLRGLRRRSATPRSARSTTAAGRCSAAATRSAAARGGGGAGGADFGSFSDILSGIFNSGGGRGGARTKPAAERGARPRDDGLAVLRAGDRRARRCRSPWPPTRRARPAAAPAPSRARSPIVCPVCNGRGVESQGQGVFSITRPCIRCGGSGTVIEHPCHTCARRGPHCASSRSTA